MLLDVSLIAGLSFKLQSLESTEGYLNWRFHPADATRVSGSGPTTGCRGSGSLSLLKAAQQWGWAFVCAWVCYYGALWITAAASLITGSILELSVHTLEDSLVKCNLFENSNKLCWTYLCRESSRWVSVVTPTEGTKSSISWWLHIWLNG